MKNDSKLSESHEIVSRKRTRSLSATQSIACDCIVVEPFYGGSHKQLVDLLVKSLDKTHCSMKVQTPGQHLEGRSPSVTHGAYSFNVHTLPAKKWHWRLLVSAAHFAFTIPSPLPSSVHSIFATSMLNLAELIALRPDISRLHKVLYFHENQLAFPSRCKESVGQRDWGLRWGQVMSALVADVVLFNSRFNMESFLGDATGIPALLRKAPKGARPCPKEMVRHIRAKSKVLHFPLHIDTPPVTELVTEQHLEKNAPAPRPLHIVWAHRWEYDKGPDKFFRVLLELLEAKVPFTVSVLGESFPQSPAVFEEARSALEAASRISHWGYLPSRKEYLNVLHHADVFISTAGHEFYGVSTLEAVWQGCFPLCPNALAYPEYLPKDCLYNTERQLVKRLRDFCRRPEAVRRRTQHVLKGIDIKRFHWSALRRHYELAMFPLP